jgi:hypothetical protein
MGLPIYCIVEGRRPVGFIPLDLEPKRGPVVEAGISSTLGEYFAQAAYLEASSAMAFARLGSELDAHEAPRALIDRCGIAQESELKHARSFGLLASELGSEPTRPQMLHGRHVRPLVDIALKNAVEGLVRQMYGATVARFRARTASDPKIQRVMAEVAEDEQENAQLAFDLGIWLQTAIDPIEGVWVENAMRHAAVSLVREIDVEVASELCDRAGVPTRRDALAIWSGLSHRVWHGITERVWNAAA